MKQNTVKQLMFDDATNKIIEEPIKYWKNFKEVPAHIKNFIISTANSRVIYDSTTKQYHCSKCLGILDSNYYCSNCAKQLIIPKSNDSKYIINTCINNIRKYSEYSYYFVFDIVDGQVLIYIFRVCTYYDNYLMSVPYQTNDIIIEEVYHITNDGVTSLLTNVFSSFKEYDKSMDDENFNFDLLNVFEFQRDNHFLYINNLSLLQNIPFYQYTNIWELKEYYENENFTLASLTYYPIHFKTFEYLVKMKLYCLAATGSNLINYKNNFKDTFGIDKNYYSFMKEIDIDSSQLTALRIYPTTDINLINFISNDTFLFEELSNYIDIGKVKKYLENQKLDYHNIYEYYDYIKCCEHMGLDLKDKQVLFPKHFTEQHDKLTAEMIIATDPKINEKIHSLSNILELNIYEDDKYIIFPADSTHSLIDESSQMFNCVRNYCEKMSNNECQIYFMRYKDSINKSLVTIEVRDGKIVQARTKFNELPTDEMNEVLKKWEKEIVPILNEKDILDK